MLPYSTPESLGVPSGALATFLRTLNARVLYPQGLVFVRHGHVVCEAYWSPAAPDIPHQLFSLSKSFTSSAIGIAIGEGRLSLDDTALSFFPEYDTAAVSPLMRRVTVRHLLTMSCGHAECPSHMLLEADPACDLVKGFLETPPVYEPGTHFAYNSVGTYMLSSILRRVTGENLTDYLLPRMFEPLGIGPVYSETCLCHGTDMGGWGLWASTRQLALAGQLWLRRGNWNGRQIIPEDYMREATSWQIQNGPGPIDWVQGYGFQFWQCQHRCFRGDGAYGQYVVMDPRHDSVLVINSAIRDMQKPLDIFWETMVNAQADKPLPENPAALDELRSLERSFQSPMATRVAAQAAAKAPEPVPAPRTFSADSNPWGLATMSLSFRAGGADAVLAYGDRTARFAADYGEPAVSMAEMIDAGHAIEVASNLEWVAPDHARIVALCPGAVNRFRFDVHFEPDGSARLDIDTWLWFFHGELEKGTVTLRPSR